MRESPPVDAQLLWSGKAVYVWFNALARVIGFAGASGSAKMAHVEVEAKAGVTVSSKDEVSVGAEVRASAGPEGVGVKVDKGGVHTEHGATVSHDTKLGVHAHAGLGLGVAVNLSQAKRALRDTGTSLINAAGNVNRLINGVNPFRFGPGGGPNFIRPMGP